jgi:hypothetical protein
MGIIFRANNIHRWLYATKGRLYDSLLMNNRRNICSTGHLRCLSDFHVFANSIHHNVKQDDIFLVKEVFNNPRPSFYS